MRGRLLTALLAVALGLVVAGPAAAQGEASVEISEVNVARYPRVTMVVELQGLEEALDPAALQVTENGEPVSDLTVGGIEESAVEVGIVLLIDTSGSMAGEPIEAARQAAAGFVAEMRAQDRVAILGFGSEVRVYAPFTNSPGLLAGAIEQLEAAGETALYDGVVAAAQMYSGEAAQLERNLIVLSDGADTVSTATLEEARAALLDREIRLFAVALTSPDFDPLALQELVAATDGLYLETTDPSELGALYGRIQRELDNRLVVRFTATQQEAGQVEYTVAYRGLTATRTVQVPGFATTVPVESGPAGTFPEPEVIQVQSRAPVDITSLLALGVGATALAVVLLVWILAGPSGDKGSALKARLQAYARAGRGQLLEEKPRLMARIPIVRHFTEGAEAVAKRRGLTGALNSALEQADIPLRPGEALVGGVALALVGGVITGVMTRSVVFGLVGMAAGFILLALLVQWVGSREKRKFEQQLPDTLTLIATSLRAGYSLLQAVEAVAEEAPKPTSREFARAIAESRLGRPVVDAMTAIAERMQSQDFAWAVMAIEIQREVGGNLAEVLSIVADTMRQRNRLKGEIKALTAEGRISAIVLAAMPFALFLFLWSTNRDYMEVLFQRTFGVLAVGIGVLLIGVGIVWMKKIVDIEV